MLFPGTGEPGGVYLISPDPIEPGAWRCTSFWPHGAAGHTTHADFATALTTLSALYHVNVADGADVTLADVDVVALRVFNVRIGHDDYGQDAAYTDWIVNGCKGPPPLTRAREDAIRCRGHQESR